jgi:D-2-hydroxyglutarate dehydrogenase
VHSNVALLIRRHCPLLLSGSGAGQLQQRRSLVNVSSASTNVHEDYEFFRSVLGSEGVKTDESSSLEAYNTDWLGHYCGSSKIVVLPRSTAQVSAVLKYCHSKSIQVVPQGGNTGLVGGSVPVHDELVLSLSRMNVIESFDEQSGVVVCQAGCILQDVDEWLGKQNPPFMTPIDLGAKGSCQIGGNLSTNAGGVRFLRYGSLRGSVVGLEVVLADGTILNTLSQCVKDNTGIFLPSLFIGSEGTLGVITRAALKCPTRPAFTNVCLLACETFEQVLNVYSQSRSVLGETLSAVEFIDGDAMQMTLVAFPSLTVPFSRSKHGYYILLEASGCSEEHTQAKMESLLEQSFSSGMATDGVVAQGLSQAAELWALREHVPLASQSLGYQRKYDVSLPLLCFPDMIAAIRKQLQSKGKSSLRVVGYGHMGDSNLHVNVCGIQAGEEAAVSAILEPFVYECVVAHGGSISAEHGVGRLKRPYLHLQKSQEVIDAMRYLKNALDPKGILNPHKVLPE